MDSLGRAAPQGRNTLQQWGRPILGIALSLLFLALALRGVDLAHVWQSLRRANLLLIALAVLIVALTNAIKALRWQAILAPHSQAAPLARLFAVIMITQTMNTFAPLRVGDVARAYMLPGVGVGTALYTIVVEKALDSAALLLTLAAVTLAMPLPGWLKQSGVALALALVAALGGLIVAGRGSRYLLLAAASIERRWPALGRLALARRVDGAAKLARSLSQGRVLAPALGWTAFIWLLGAGANYITFLALGLSVPDPLLAACFLLVVLYLGAVVPSSPGKVGLFHYLVVISLALFGVDRDPAFGYGVALHLVVYGTISLLGAWCLWRRGPFGPGQGRG